MLLGGVEVTNCAAAGGLEEVIAAPTTPTGKCDGVPRAVSVSEVLGRIFLGGVPVLGTPPAVSLNRL